MLAACFVNSTRCRSQINESGVSTFESEGMDESRWNDLRLSGSALVYSSLIVLCIPISHRNPVVMHCHVH